MLRPLLRVSLLSCLAATACKDKEKASADPKAAPAAATIAPVAPVPGAATPVQPDLALIDATLEKLGDATVASAATAGLPHEMGEVGIACGTEVAVSGALKHIGFASEPLEPGKGFLFQDVCIGWRPYVAPVTEIYWMISAGAPAEGEKVMPVRRCLQVLKTENGFAKAPITDGPCLTMHRME